SFAAHSVGSLAPQAKRSGERGGVRGAFAARPPHPILPVATTEPPSPRKRGEGAITTTARAVIVHHFKQPVSFPRRVLRPGFAFWLRATPRKGWRSAERRTDACEASVGPALSGQARHLARRLASPYGGRPPPGARTVAILGAGAALPVAGIGAGSVTANSHIRVVVPGGGPCLPGRQLRAAAAGRHASLRLQEPPDDAPSMSKAGILLPLAQYVVNSEVTCSHELVM